MIVLVANLGSTSFKYKLYDMADVAAPAVLATGAADRIGQGGSAWSIRAGARADSGTADLADHAAAVELHLAKLVELGAIDSIEALDAIGFKAVHGGPISGAVEVDDEVIATMERIVPLAPAHNPPYLAAMRSFKEKLPRVRQVAAFETAFHATIPAARQAYGVPHEWIERYGIRRYGFHGASNAYIARRMVEIAPDCRKVINLHLGGSSSICAIADGRSVAHSMGCTPQTGTFHANRVGDFDAFAVLALAESGLAIERIYEQLSTAGGLLGLSGVSADMREVEQAAAGGDARAQLAIDAFVESCRHHVGASLVALGGADAVVFTAGIGQHSPVVRAAICAELDFAGIVLDEKKNHAADGEGESRLDAADSRAQIWVVPTDEELIVARQTVEVVGVAVKSEK